MTPRIHWKGEGAPVLFFPGWNTSAAMVMSWLPGDLSTRFRVGVLEWPGVGRAAADPVPKDLEDFLDELADEVPDGASVVGFCLGGVAAWAFAQRHPDRVDRVVVAESPRHFPAILAPLLVPGLGSLVLRVAKDTAQGRAWVRLGILQRHREYPQAFLACLFDFTRKASLQYLRLFWRFGRRLKGPFRAQPACWRLEGERPLRVMVPALGPRHAIPAEVLRLPGAGHFPAVETPEAFFAALEGILSASLSPVPTEPAPGR